MTDFEAVDIIIDAIERLSNQTIMLKMLNDSIGGECTRIMNAYSEFIGVNNNDEEARVAWGKASKILQKCEEVDEKVTDYKELLKDLLDFLSNLGKQA